MSRAAHLCGVSLILAACGRAPAAATGADAFIHGASGHAVVTYQPGIHIVDRATGLAALRGQSTDGSVFLFDAGNSRFAELKNGDVLLITGLIARRVLATERAGPNVAILTDPVSVGDVVRDGHVDIRAPVRFSARAAQGTTVSPRPPWRRLLALAVPDASAQAPAADQANSDAPASAAATTIKGTFKGWNVTFAATPSAGRLDLSITLTKNVGGFIALITGKGYLADFDMLSTFTVTSGTLDQIAFINERLNGAMNFNWEVSKQSPGALSDNDRIKLPAAFSIPLYKYLDGMPLYLDVSSAVIIEPAISGGREYSRGAFRITYDGTQGVQVKRGNMDADGNVTGDIQFLESQNISLAPLGMVVAFAAPRIELSFGTTKILAFSSDMTDAAAGADLIEQTLVEKLYGTAGLEKLKANPLGGFSWGQAIHDAISSDATGYVELVTSTGMSHSGASAIIPCTRTDIHLSVTVGASAQAFGQKLGESKKEAYRRDFTRVDPPTARLCAGVGSSP